MMADIRSLRRIALVVLTRAGLEYALRVQPWLEGDVHIYASERAVKISLPPPAGDRVGDGVGDRVGPPAGHPQGMPLQWYEHTSQADSYHCRGIPCGCPAA